MSNDTRASQTAPPRSPSPGRRFNRGEILVAVAFTLVGLAVAGIAGGYDLAGLPALCAALGPRRARELVLSAREVSAAGDSDDLLHREAVGQAVLFDTSAHRDAVDRFLNNKPAAFQWPRDCSGEQHDS